MTPPRAAMLIAAVALALLVGVGVSELSRARHGTGSEPFAPLTRDEMTARLSGSPPQLAELHAQANRLLGGDWSALQRRLRALRGYPIVVNKWASWCGPCRAEFAIFQRASVDLGRRVAFIGLDSGDSERSKALAFLRSLPVSYPSFYDPGEQAAEQLTYASFTPITVFIGPDGKRYPRLGPYTSLGKLERDVQRYAVDA